MSDPLIGTTLGGCMLLEVIGQGGMGVIYKGRQKSLDRIVAVKILAPHLANDLTFVARFQREARAIARINHPNILAVYDVGDDQNINYMIMELIEGCSLDELHAERGGIMNWEETVNYIRQAAEGLEAAQSANIIHRDIKPDNIMVTRKGIVKVSDFGLAKESDNPSGGPVIDEVMGTPAFMSPEQCDGKKVDARSDIYSLGGTFYKMVTGRLPFEAETAMSMMYRHKHEALIPPHEVVPELPEQISAIICRMMAKRKEHRYQSMTEVIQAIDGAVQDIKFAPQQQGEGEYYDPQGGMAYGSEYGSPNGNAFEGGGGFAGQQAGWDGMGGAQGVLPPQPELQQVEEVPPEGEEAYQLVAQGDDSLSRGDRLMAVKFYRRALTSPTLDDSTRYRIETEYNQEFNTRRMAAESLFKRGMLHEAGREYKCLQEIDPTNEQIKNTVRDIEHKITLKKALVTEIRTAITASMYDQAVKLWDAAPSDLRDDALGKQVENIRNVVLPSAKLSEQGDAHNRQGRLEEAMAAYDDAIKINPSCEQARAGLKEVEQKVQKIEYMLKEGYQYSLEQNYGKAIQTWKPILELRPGHPQAIKSIMDAYVAYAGAVKSQGEIAHAIELYTAALEIDPQNRTISRLLDEMTTLSEKETALIDRAHECERTGRLGEAINCWREIQRMNPANRKTVSMITKLQQQRRGNYLYRFVTVLVLIIGSVCGIQYYREYDAVRNAKRELDAERYESVKDIFANTMIIFMSRKRQVITEDAEFRQRSKQADDLRAEGKLEQARELYKELAVAMRSRGMDSFVYDLEHKAVLCDLDFKRAVGRESRLSRKWDRVKTHYEEMLKIIIDNAKFEKDLVSYREETDYSIELSNLMIQADRLAADRIKNKAYDVYKQAFDLAKKGNYGEDVKAVQIKMGELGYEPDHFTMLMNKAVDALKAGPQELETAVRTFGELHNYDPNEKQAEALLRYSTDMSFCAQFGMAMYTPVNPLTSKTWGFWNVEERKAAFCVDRYEWPNQSGALPKGGLSWVEAAGKCRDVGKSLCSRTRWIDACKAGELSRLYPYGAGKNPGDDCNTGSSAPVASGSRPKCVNAYGIYDMSGNLAEWTLENPNNSAQIYGGSYATPAARANCGLDYEEQSDRTSSPEYGFRCCRSLPEKR